MPAISTTNPLIRVATLSSAYSFIVIVGQHDSHVICSQAIWLAHPVQVVLGHATMENKKNSRLFSGPLANYQDLNSNSPTVSYTDSGHSPLPRCQPKGLPRMMPSDSSSQTSSQPRNFEFVLVTDNQSRRQVRRHAMRHHMRQRRLDSIARLSTTSARVGGWVTLEATCTFLSGHLGRPENIQVGPQVNSEISDLDQEEPTTEKGDGLLPLVPASQLDISTREFDPRALPGASGICDPFNSYPIALQQADHELIQHCKWSPCIMNWLVYMECKIFIFLI